MTEDIKGKIEPLMDELVIDIRGLACTRRVAVEECLCVFLLPDVDCTQCILHTVRMLGWT